MELMENKIRREGKVLPGGILKVGSFLNQMIDTAFLREIGREIARLFDGCGVTKILTIESSGIAIAVAAGLEMDVPVVFAKKHKTSNVDGSVYSTVVHSYTHNADYTVVVSSDYLRPGDKVLLVDDFLANGEAALGASSLLERAGAEVAGIGIVIAKTFQPGLKKLQEAGYRVEILAPVKRMAENLIEFD